MGHGDIRFSYLMVMSTKSEEINPIVPLEFVTDPVNARLPKAFVRTLKS